MKAIIRTKAGKEFSTMQMQELTSPSPAQDQIKIKMVSSRVNPVDMDLMKGFPSLKYKNPQIGGVDGAGEILELGSGVSGFEIGEKVFFYRKFSDIGTWAEEVTINASDVAKIPTHWDVEQAGAAALPLLTAYEAIQSLNPKTGQTILIHGAGGGVGYQAVQVAKALGLEVIANASDRDKSALEAVGVNQLVNYKTEDFAEVLATRPPDLVFDVIGKETLLKSIKLKPQKVVSMAFADTSKMGKTGVKLPGLLKLLMKLMMGKFVKTAKKSSVALIGQVTGANGKLLQEASNMASEYQFQIREYRKIPLDNIGKNGMDTKALGGVLVFS